MKTGHCLAYVTCANEEDALKLGREMVDRQLAACANILPTMKSCFFWEGQPEVTSESVLILKTTEKIYSELEDAVVAAHTYDVPCVLKIKLDGGNPKFLDWITTSLSRTEQERALSPSIRTKS